jgi:hypothetical protein
LRRLTTGTDATADVGFIFLPGVEPCGPRDDQTWGVTHWGRNAFMKIALLALLGLMLGALGGAALGVGAGLAWVEIFKTTGFEGYSGMLVFFTFMPVGAAIGGLGGALLFGVVAARDDEIAVRREPAGPHDR